MNGARISRTVWCDCAGGTVDVNKCHQCADNACNAPADDPFDEVAEGTVDAAPKIFRPPFARQGPPFKGPWERQ
jgi:hypothetical protein